MNDDFEVSTDVASQTTVQRVIGVQNVPVRLRSSRVTWGAKPTHASSTSGASNAGQGRSTLSDRSKKTEMRYWECWSLQVSK
ncbi:hypothetical protein HYQ44_013373 [Verticillium longisporum]|nr:hypothetical protein HYQ44_013373 [Verticillium longisporum]